MINLEPSVVRMSRDIRAAAASLSDTEARYFVDTYYQHQEARIREQHRIRQQEQSGEPHATLVWLKEQYSILEQQIKGALSRYAEAHPVGRWAQQIPGIGPVIAAGLLANIDITRCPTAGSIWKFAGLDGTPKKLEKGVKRTWSTPFKTLCAYKIGESFVKVKGNPNDIYGKFYESRKKYEQEKNEAGEYAEQARMKLENFRIGKETEAYKWYSQGKLPPAHIHARARRYAVKIFLSHLHEVWYWHAFGQPAPRPYAIAHLGHAHDIKPPFFDPATFPLRDPLLPPPRKEIEPEMAEDLEMEPAE